MRAFLEASFRSPFMRFLFAGGVAALVNILTRIELSNFMGFTPAIIIAYLFGMTTAYVLMRAFAFERSGRHLHQEYIRFGLVNLFALFQIWLISVGLEDYVFPWIGFVRHSETVAHSIGVLSPTITSYFLHKYFTFSKR
ncbi:GtrA family protein [Martelella mediterranea]|nr:GtrA family protein [Martelella mediterranea]